MKWFVKPTKEDLSLISLAPLFILNQKLAKAKIEFHLGSPSRTFCASSSFPNINVLRGLSSWSIGPICTWPSLPQDWKLACPTCGFLKPSALPCRALLPVHQMSILFMSWLLYRSLWQGNDDVILDCLSWAKIAPLTTGRSESIFSTLGPSPTLLDIRIVVYIIKFCQPAPKI